MAPETAYTNDLDQNIEDGDSMVVDEKFFVDYVVPTPPSTKPPPKYKSWIVVLSLVYPTLWIMTLSGFTTWLVDTFRLHLNTAIFIQLCLVVFVLIYAGVDVVVFFCRVKIRDEWYGLGRLMADPYRVR